ncbi:MAG: hypothetical protein KDK70_25055, partial [Myxococcales bacterium]|nr:hypothetical protein [Myxococcales bacterium]
MRESGPHPGAAHEPVWPWLVRGHVRGLMGIAMQPPPGYPPVPPPFGPAPHGAPLDDAPARTRQWALGSLGAGGTVIVVTTALIALDDWSAIALVPVAMLAQVILGLLAFGTGRAGVARRRRLAAPVPLEETVQLRRWSIIGLVTAIFGMVGGLVAIGLVVLVIAAFGAAGGAWGRPLRVGRKTVAARLDRGGHRWADGPAPEVDDLDPDTRRALGLLWLHDAKKEQASVPAFAQLTWQLAVVGAPSELLERCQHSAQQEIDHARRCFSVVEAYLGQEQTVGPIDEVPARLSLRGGRRRCITRVALETLEDGCLIEDLNADFAERAHALATDPAARSLTACIAREEREHAELAWDIVAWCVAQDPRVARAVRRRLDRLPRRVLAPYPGGTI